MARSTVAAVVGVAALVLQSVGSVLAPAEAATPLNVFVGYMDTHSVASSAKQPKPWPYTDPTSYVGSPCPAYPNSTTCWDAAALRLDNPGSVDVTGIHPVVTIGSSTYNLWGSNLTVKAHGTLVLTETGAQNSTNFDGSDFAPNSYNGGNTASCVNSGAIPDVKITLGGATTTYLDSGQVLNGGGVDSGHCVNGSFVSGRIDESHPWVQIGTAAAAAPAAPQSLAAVAGDGSVNLSWAAPTSDGGSPVTGYTIYRGTSAGGESATPIATNVKTTTYADTGRVNGTTYFYTVAAVNAVGTSPQSNEASATPQSTQPTAPTAPTGLAAVAGNASVTLSWTAPTSDGGSAITGYTIYRGSAPGGESATPIATNVRATSFTDTGEVNGSAYYYKVAAVNAVGTSPQSNEASATPRGTVSSAPVGLVASAGDTSVALSWQMPASDGGSGITGYNVYRGTSAGGESSVPVASNVALTSFTDTSVSNGATYFYTVAAVNGVGTSPQSNEASATPQSAATVPSAPQSLAAAATNTTVALTWTAPASNGGSAVTGYNVYRGTSAGGESATAIASNVSGTSFTDTGLVNGTAYFYRVAAVNAVGTSALSNEASATPRATPPSSPLSLAAVAGNGSVALSWTAPASNGGSAVTGYNVYRGTSAGAEGATPVASNVSGTSFTDTSVSNGTAYFYRVAAVNAVGTSPLSNEASATPQAAVAAGYVGRVGSATASAARTTTTLTVGSSGVQAGHTLVVSLLLSSTSITGAVSVKDSAGNTYAVVRDVNDGSAGDRAVTVVALSVKALPAGSTITLTYSSAGETHVSVDELAGVTGIDTSAGATGTGTAFSSGSVTTTQPNEILFGVVGVESAATVPAWAAGWSGLPNLSVSTDDLATAFRVTTATGAYTASGTSGGQWMAAITALKTGAPSPPSVPSAPTGLVGTPGNASVSLSWAAPASNGGAAVTGYNVYRGTTAGGESSVPVASSVSGTSFTDTGLVNGTAYFYTVAAVNAAGTSPPSNEASATPQSAVMVPSAPTGLVGTPGNGSVSLSWAAPASNGGAAVTGYNVYRGTTAGGESSVPVASSVSGTSFTDTGLVNGTAYFYTVAAVNAAGTSPPSNEASATPQSAVMVPSAPTGLVGTPGNGSVALSWTAPASNGGSAVTGYNVYRGTSAGGESATAIASNVSGTSFTDTGLVNGTAYFYRVAAVNAVGTSPLSTEASGTPQAAVAAGYVGRVGSATASAARTTTTLTVGSSGVQAGHTLVVSLLLSSTSITGAVSVKDSAGNTYAVVRDVNDGSAGDRAVTVVALSVKALPAGSTITLTYSSAGETHVSVDELAGVTGIDTSAGATGTGTAFSSGSVTTTQPNEILFGVVGVESAATVPAWAAGWSGLPNLSVSTDDLATAFRVTTATGAYTASGTSGGQWMAAITAFKTS